VPGLPGSRQDKRYRPYSLRRRVRRIPILTAVLEKSTEGARDARVLTDPRTSTPRDIEACRSPNSRKSAVSMASRARCLRFAPPRPRWTSRFRRPAFPLELEGPPIHRCGLRRGAATYDRLPAPPSRGPRDARLARRDEAAWTARTSCRISDTKEFPGHRSPPRVWKR